MRPADPLSGGRPPCAGTSRPALFKPGAAARARPAPRRPRFRKGTGAGRRGRSPARIQARAGRDGGEARRGRVSRRRPPRPVDQRRDGRCGNGGPRRHTDRCGRRIGRPDPSRIAGRPIHGRPQAGPDDRRCAAPGARRIRAPSGERRRAGVRRARGDFGRGRSADPRGIGSRPRCPARSAARPWPGSRRPPDEARGRAPAPPGAGAPSIPWRDPGVTGGPGSVAPSS